MKIDHQYWTLVDQRGNTVAKMETKGGWLLPDDVAETFDVVEVDADELGEKTVDHSQLTDDELALLNRVYSVRF